MSDAFKNDLLPNLSVGGEEVAAGLRADLETFSDYIRTEIAARELFGVIARKLVEERPDEIVSDIDVASGRVGLEVAKMTGSMPMRLTDPDLPLTQDICYPSVQLPDGTYAVLAEVVRYRQDINSQVVSRTPWLYVLDADAHQRFGEGSYDYLADIAEESYCRSDLDATGRTDGQTPFSDALALFFGHPVSDQAQSKLLTDRRELVQDQARYFARLQVIAGVVLRGGMGQ